MTVAEDKNHLVSSISDASNK